MHNGLRRRRSPCRSGPTCSPHRAARRGRQSRVLRTRLRHAPTPLAANDLDMRVGHPAVAGGPIFPSEVLTPRRRVTAQLITYRSGPRKQEVAGRFTTERARYDGKACSLIAHKLFRWASAMLTGSNLPRQSFRRRPQPDKSTAGSRFTAARAERPRIGRKAGAMAPSLTGRDWRSAAIRGLPA